MIEPKWKNSRLQEKRPGGRLRHLQGQVGQDIALDGGGAKGGGGRTVLPDVAGGQGENRREEGKDEKRHAELDEKREEG